MKAANLDKNSQMQIGWASDNWNTLTVYGILFIYQIFLPTVLFLMHRFVISQRKLLQVTPLGWHIEMIIRSVGKASNW